MELKNTKEFSSLFELMNSALSENGLEYKSIEDFITDDEKAKDFITKILDLTSFKKLYETSKKYAISQARARHQAITFLMGLIFIEFGKSCNCFHNINDKIKINELRLWQMISLHHDMGYYVKALQSNNTKLGDYEPQLLCDNYGDINDLNEFKSKNEDVFAYDYEEIINYFEYSKNYHASKVGKNNDDKECVDHGILGAVVVFDERIKEFKKLKGEDVSNQEISTSYNLQEIKKYCMIIAQHNMFKSPNEKIDKIYKEYKLNSLLSTSLNKVGTATPWLLYLSLIDTFECVKMFSKSADDKHYLETLTVLKNIRVKISINKISIDYSSLYNVCKEKPSQKVFESYLNSVLGLNSWTELETKRINDCNIDIWLRSENRMQ